jgi:hypothetical protein
MYICVCTQVAVHGDLITKDCRRCHRCGVVADVMSAPFKVRADPPHPLQLERLRLASLELDYGVRL